MKPYQKISVFDQTEYVPSLIEEDISQPDYNILIMGQFPKGATNKLIQFKPGRTQDFIRNVAAPNYPKYGFGPDIAVEALNKGFGVYVANLRPDDAKMANVALSVKYKINEDVQKTNAQGDPLYLTSEGVETTVSTGNTAIVRDVLDLRFVTTTSASVTDNDTLKTALDANYSVTPDIGGYKTIPLVAFRYVGASLYGNNFNFRLVPTKGSDGNVYYKAEIYNGTETFLLPDVVSLFPMAYLSGMSMFIENVFNRYDCGIRVVTSNHIDKFFTDVLGTHFANLDYAPESVDLFAANKYDIITDDESLAASITGAFKLQNGNDGATGQLDTQIQALFTGQIVPDIKSILRYKISLIPDLDYSATVKQAIATFTAARSYSTVGTAMLGTASFDDAITDRTTNFAGNYPLMRFIAKAQSAYRYNTTVRRNLKMPAAYYDTMAIIDFCYQNNGLDRPFAGVNARWKDFDEETMKFPKEDDAFLSLLTDNRINVVKKDRASGAYLFTQDMGVLKGSDLMEFSNVLILGRIIYDTIDLAHKKNYGFNDQSDIARYNEDIAVEITSKYSPSVYGIKADVRKKGLTGEDKATNIIALTINFKDIVKATEIQITITDEEIAS